jgi:hypothetical protein
MIYFLQSGANGPIKIGTSRTSEQRVRDLKTSCPYPANLLATVEGGRSLERRIHSALRQHRTNGEWFRPSVHTLCVVQAAKAGSGPLEDALQSIEAQHSLTMRRLDAAGHAMPYLIGAVISEIRQTLTLAEISSLTGINDAELLRFQRGETAFGVTKFWALKASFPRGIGAVEEFVEAASIETLEAIDSPEKAREAIDAQLSRLGPSGEVAA